MYRAVVASSLESPAAVSWKYWDSSTSFSPAANDHAWGGRIREGFIPIREAIRQLAPHIVTCHVHDNNGLSDQHLCPGLGTCDFDAVFEELAKCPRLQSVQNETSFHAGGTTIGHACRVFDGLMAKLGR